MERGRGLRLTTNRVLLFVAVVVLVLLAFASALGEVEVGSDTGEAARDWVALLIVPLALAGVGYVYTSYETRRTRAVEQTIVVSRLLRTGRYLRICRLGFSGPSSARQSLTEPGGCSGRGSWRIRMPALR